MDVTVIVFTRPNMFAVNENLYHMIGYGVLKGLFSDPDFKSDGRCVLFYPERFLNILEQRELIPRAEKAGISELEIVTHSVYIVQCVKKEDVRIVDDDEIKEGSQFKLSNDKSGMPNDAGLGIL